MRDDGITGARVDGERLSCFRPNSAVRLSRATPPVRRSHCSRGILATAAKQAMPMPRTRSRRRARPDDRDRVRGGRASQKRPRRRTSTRLWRRAGAVATCRLGLAFLWARASGRARLVTAGLRERKSRAPRCGSSRLSWFVKPAVSSCSRTLACCANYDPAACSGRRPVALRLIRRPAFSDADLRMRREHSASFEHGFTPAAGRRGRQRRSRRSQSWRALAFLA